jgi:hypothetical protein
MRWKRRVEDLLYDGEYVEESIEIETARVVVTSHRVLAFTPEMEGENFTQADLPNVESVDASSRSDGGLLSRAVQFGVVGAVLLVLGLVIDFESILGGATFDADAAQEVGAGGIISLAQRFISFMIQLDYLMRVFGALALLLAAVMFGVYWFLRDPTLKITVAGDKPDIQLPRPADVSETRARLEAAIFPEAAVEDTNDTGKGVGTETSFSDRAGGDGVGSTQDRDARGFGETMDDESVFGESAGVGESSEDGDVFGNAGGVDDDTVSDS